MDATQIFRARKKVATLALTALTAAVAACGSGDATGPEGTARIRVLLTDAPTDMLDSAHVWISRVYLVGGGGESPDTAEADTLDIAGGRLDLFNDPANPLKFDLLTLRDGITADLTGEVPVEATTYRGLRFVVDSARVTLAEGFLFDDGSRVGAMKVPSGQQSGIKVKLRDILDATEDDLITVTVDFDVDQNFNIQIDNQTGRVRKILFKPVLTEKGREKR